MKKKGVGSHTRPNEGEYTIWLTPRAIIWALGEFDLDPCAAPSPRPWATAKEHIELPQDGTLADWQGRVWLNPPYDQNIDKWLQRMAMHGDGIALIFARTETEAWNQWVWPYAKAVLFIAGRLYFCYQDGSEADGNAGGPSALIAYSEKDAKRLRSCGISGALVKVISPSCEAVP